MGRPRKAAPDLYWYATRQQWAVNLNGNRKCLGPNRQEADQKRLALLHQWHASGGGDVPQPTAKSYVVAEVLRDYERTCASRVCPKQLHRIETACDAARTLYADLPAAAFGAPELTAVRQWLIRQNGKQPPYRPLSRHYVNRLVGCLQTAWVWIESQRMVPTHSAVTLKTIKALRKKGGGREVVRRRAVARSVVEAFLPYADPVLAAMVRVQSGPGMRPQDVCGIKPRLVSRDPNELLYPLDENLAVSAFTDPATGVFLWVYCPEEHKGTKREKPRVIVLGPKVQEVLRPFLERDPDAYCFSPIEATAAQRALKRERRQSPVQPSQVQRSARAARRRRSRAIGDHYPENSYGKAIANVLLRANRQRAAEGRPPIPHFTPHQLRHATATEAANRADQHVAAAVLGDHPDLMRIYVAEQMAKAGGYAAVHG